MLKYTTVFLPDVEYIVPNKPQWCDSAFPGILNYAVKWFAVAPASVTTTAPIPYGIHFFMTFLLRIHVDCNVQQ